MELADYRLLLPDFPSDEEWIQTIEQAEEGCRRDALTALVKGCNLLAGVAEEGMTPERLGWLSLLVKIVTGLRSACEAVDSPHSGWLLQMANRCLTEWELHMNPSLPPKN